MAGTEDKDAVIAALTEEVAGLKQELTDVGESMSRLESMALQSSMNSSKQNKVLSEALERLEGMSMSQSMNVAKFEKRVDERLGNVEGMLMQSAMNVSKWQKTSGDKASSMEAMLQAMSSGATQEGYPPQGGDSSDSSSDDEAGSGFQLDEATTQKLKAATYEKLAKSKSQTVEELKASMKDATVSTHRTLKSSLAYTG
jgi:hypothetical protein